jgi:hypothetical protein
MGRLSGVILEPFMGMRRARAVTGGQAHELVHTFWHALACNASSTHGLGMPKPDFFESPPWYSRTCTQRHILAQKWR